MDLDSMDCYVNQTFSKFGANKKREVRRLLFEISKREGCDVVNVMKEYKGDVKNFVGVKEHLIRRRFPDLTKDKQSIKPFLPELDIKEDEKAVVEGNRRRVIPKSFLVEKEVLNSEFVTQLKRKYPEASFGIINSYAEECKKKKYGIKDFNNRLENFYIIKESFDFFKRCPCSPKMVPCGYHLINLGSGCAFECTYCYLQEYINSPGIVIPANIEGFFEKFSEYKQNVYIGSGEFTDSLVFDHITEFSPKIVNFFKNYPKSIFEFKTKSDNIDLLKTVKPEGNIVVAWSMNPQKVIDTTEFFTASLEQRLKAADICQKLGYKIAFHFDPVIYYDGWEDDYTKVVDKIFGLIDKKNLDRISLGTLRMVPDLKKIIENRFPENTILDGEIVLGYDKKLRYGYNLRSEMYKKMLTRIRGHSSKVHVYLCMEEKALCQECKTYPVSEGDSRCG
ncbi:Spore photoproduct lyase [hydrothermal vent metagenome]|uniref:Spore photoproduct lyase n=1 Tax=hydrothermal vent metagenome TaxID=652676 RepID=A0A3B1E0C2_9ZZZZ